MNKESARPVTLKVNIEAGALKRVVEEGRLMEFANALSAQVAGDIKGQIIEQLAKVATGEAKIGGAVSFTTGYIAVWPFGTGPWPPGPPTPYIDTVPLPERGLRRIVR